ncbi:MAG: DUF5615 family PIN-like protein [Bacteroidetes bacterium]|nr:DUF5615 family PIN-like protein [Bacteroidota bacterium]
MKLLLDENVPDDILQILRIKRIPVRHVHNTPVSGSNDEQIFLYAVKRKMTLISFDRDFLDDIYFEKMHYGIIFIVSRNKNLRTIAQSVSKVISENKSLKNRVVIIE